MPDFVWNHRFADRRCSVEATACSTSGGDVMVVVRDEAGQHISFRIGRAKALELARGIGLALGTERSPA